MFSHHVHGALARERASDMRAKAQAARSGRARADAPPARRTRRPRGRGRRPTEPRPLLRDGSKVLIRQVRSADAPLLADGFARLSARSRQMRFLTPKKELSPAELRYFTDVDHHDHEALGALDHADGRGVGIARYVRDADDPQAAEIAVTIVDDWQGRGLGTELLAQLSGRAREGIRRFTALVAADNPAMAGPAAEHERQPCRAQCRPCEYEITLGPADEYGLDWWLRCVDD